MSVLYFQLLKEIYHEHRKNMPLSHEMHFEQQKSANILAENINKLSLIHVCQMNVLDNLNISRYPMES